MIHCVSNSTLRRLRLAIHGTVQGVGFRPFVYRLAQEMGLAGWIVNTSQGVTIEVEGNADRLTEFCSRIATDKPPASTIASTESKDLDPLGFTQFEIRTSQRSGDKTALILPDLATCPDCLRDILDPSNRRFRYPFTNCTHCGPRFSIIEALPYDRASTSMKHFTMCPACRCEYEDPTDRRFHAQPNACPQCGPHLELWDPAGHVACDFDEALQAAADSVRRGRILALKGLGGFQLIVDARDEHAVALLRRRKHHEEKPFALMVPSIVEAQTLCHVDEVEAGLLQSRSAPIVLLKARHHEDQSVARSVAPRNPYLGVLLPYTPLHHLLMGDLAFPVVATSGNLSDEPICIDEQEAFSRLGGIADVLLVHDRPIVRHVDDSVVRVVHGREMILRRARGYAPLPIKLMSATEPILSVGAHQKSTVAFACSNQVFISQHIGDLSTLQAFEAFERAAADLPALYDTRPRIVACDLHPDYVSTRYADAMAGQVARVQHHHAHVASCIAENGLDGTVLGVAWDGTGYGPDGTIWGGEFLRCNVRGFERVAYLRCFRLPGGELAAREPRRSALGVLYELMGPDLFESEDMAPLRAFDPPELRVLAGVFKSGINCPRTSSMGRLFDAVASILNIRHRSNDEGLAAMELEFAATDSDCKDGYPFTLTYQIPIIIDWGPIIEAVLCDLMRELSVNLIARKFHNTLVEVICAVAKVIEEERVVLSGGCFQNKLLLESSISQLERHGFRPYWHQHVPPNDGGISLGQAVIAGSESRTSVRAESHATMALGRGNDAMLNQDEL